MPVLKNLKHEKFCGKIINESKSLKDAYLEVYPKTSSEPAKANSSRLLSREDVRARCLEILNSTKGLGLKDQLGNLLTLSTADKDIVVDKVIRGVKDNPTRLEAVKTILKLHGMLIGNDSQVSVDARSMTFNVSNDGINALSTIITRLEHLEQRQDRISGDIVDITNDDTTT